MDRAVTFTRSAALPIESESYFDSATARHVIKSHLATNAIVILSSLYGTTHVPKNKTRNRIRPEVLESLLSSRVHSDFIELNNYRDDFLLGDGDTRVVSLPFLDIFDEITGDKVPLSLKDEINEAADKTKEESSIEAPSSAGEIKEELKTAEAQVVRGTVRMALGLVLGGAGGAFLTTLAGPIELKPSSFVLMAIMGIIYLVMAATMKSRPSKVRS